MRGPIREGWREGVGDKPKMREYVVRYDGGRERRG